MTSQTDNAQIMDSGAFALAHFLRLHGVADAHPDQFKRRGSAPGLGLKEMLKGARKCGVKAHVQRTDWSRLLGAKFPVIALLSGGGDSLLLEKIIDDNVFVMRSSEDAHEPLVLARDNFEKIWSGDVLLTDPDFGASSGPGAKERLGGVFAGLRGVWSRWRKPVEPHNSEAGADFAPDANGDDSGLGALVLLLGFHGVGADAAQIKHRSGVARVGVVDMLRCAKGLGLKASARVTDWDRLANTPLPGIAALRDGRKAGLTKRK